MIPSLVPTGDRRTFGLLKDALSIASVTFIRRRIQLKITNCFKFRKHFDKCDGGLFQGTIRDFLPSDRGTKLQLTEYSSKSEQNLKRHLHSLYRAHLLPSTRCVIAFPTACILNHSPQYTSRTLTFFYTLHNHLKISVVYHTKNICGTP